MLVFGKGWHNRRWGILPFEIGSFSLLHTFTDPNSRVGVDSVTIDVVELTAANAVQIYSLRLWQSC